jgi:hypothetical protein
VDEVPAMGQESGPHLPRIASKLMSTSRAGGGDSARDTLQMHSQAADKLGEDVEHEVLGEMDARARGPA